MRLPLAGLSAINQNAILQRNLRAWSLIDFYAAGDRAPAFCLSTIFSGTGTYFPGSCCKTVLQDDGTSRRLASRPCQGATKAAMTQEEERELRAQLARLQQEHRDLDAAIAALQVSPGSDIIQVQRLKKRKLQLRDRITFIEDQLTPDIIA
jgi:hypothetical protein